MARFTTFRFCLDPTVEQQAMLARHAGAARFAFNHCLAETKTALNRRRRHLDVRVPWTGFDHINRFNAWKKTEDAGRVFTVDPAGAVSLTAIGLGWRNQVSQQVFEEAAVDLGHGLRAWRDSRTGTRAGPRVGFPRFKAKSSTVASFRLRNRCSPRGRASIRVGEDRPRSVTLPVIGVVRVREDTRRLRRMTTKGRARILSATISHRAGRWMISLATEAADLPAAHRHPVRAPGDHQGWVGVDRGLSALVVAATAGGVEVERVTDQPRPLVTGMRRQRRLARSVSRKQKGSRGRRAAAARLARHHHRIRNIRAHFLHQASNRLVKTHDRLVIEDLNIAGMLGNRHLARAIGDAGWGEFARQLRYKQAWRGGHVITVDRWFPSTRLCSGCGVRNDGLTLADRVFACGCGTRLDRDLNAAINLAARGEELDRCPSPGARSTSPG
ncbi:RNA-guided endonuclease InsQ/TnpB family protein [Nocardia sp. NPDC051570]|uniref:RNA-guided endonuclease InsQ/TnpB family protein n=1 Tax=Nocardia sp. NPDC051570 TaxID=3364324 RepID=UPI00378B2C27